MTEFELHMLQQAEPMLRLRLVEQEYELGALREKVAFMQGYDTHNGNILDVLLDWMGEAGTVQGKLRGILKQQESEIDRLQALKLEYDKTNDEIIDRLRSEIQRETARCHRLQAATRFTPAQVEEAQRTLTEQEVRNAALKTQLQEKQKTRADMETIILQHVSKPSLG
ncbi:hypothetical protein DIPPA_25644 [Diplonema papillatum]|nr:hypothetical protein DIPPA_25644 [Diplonema papillatum]